MANVLLVDDDADICAAISIILGTAGHRVLAVPDGYSGLAAAHDYLPDVVILDIGLPDLDGLQVCRQLRADPLTTGVPVVIVTVRALDGDTTAGFAAGATAYVTKPFSLNGLVGRVEQVLADATPITNGTAAGAPASGNDERAAAQHEGCAGGAADSCPGPPR